MLDIPHIYGMREWSIKCLIAGQDLLEVIEMLNVAVDHRAGPLKKSDLKYSYPESTEAVFPLELEEPDPVYLNRKEWYEVLYFVNMFANCYGKGSNGVAKQVERMLHEHVPPKLQSHARIRQWLLEHWKFHG